MSRLTRKFAPTRNICKIVTHAAAIVFAAASLTISSIAAADQPCKGVIQAHAKWLGESYKHRLHYTITAHNGEDHQVKYYRGLFYTSSEYLYGDCENVTCLVEKYPDVSLKDNNYMNPGFIAFNPDVAITMNPELNQLWITKKNSNVIGGEIDKVDLTCPGKAAFGVLSEKTLVQLGQYGYWADIAKTVYAISFEREVLR